MKSTRIFTSRYFSSEVSSRIYSDKIAVKGIEAELWVTILLEAYRYFKLEPRMTKRKYMLEALFSLWQGRLYEYYNSIWSLTTSEAEKIIEKEVKTFFSKREELVSV